MTNLNQSVLTHFEIARNIILPECTLTSVFTLARTCKLTKYIIESTPVYQNLKLAIDPVLNGFNSISFLFQEIPLFYRIVAWNPFSHEAALTSSFSNKTELSKKKLHILLNNHKFNPATQLIQKIIKQFTVVVNNLKTYNDLIMTLSFKKEILNLAKLSLITLFLIASISYLAKELPKLQTCGTEGHKACSRNQFIIQQILLYLILLTMMLSPLLIAVIGLMFAIK